jgi:hypothetical protein
MANLILFLVFIFFYQRIMVTQILFKLEKTAESLEDMSERAKSYVLKKVKKRPDAKLKSRVKSFLDFFVISPVNLDPYGIVKKFEYLIDLEKDRFNYFVKQIAPNFGSEERANVVMGLSGAMSLYQIAKIVRHYVELIKKTKSINLAMVLQMQLPLIESIAKALHKGTEALTNGWPIGDGIGPYIITDLIADSKYEKFGDETIFVRKKYKNKDVIIIKALGPGGRTGDLGRLMDKIASKEKIAKIITIDAALKLEGEKTGSIAEGVGVAIGGVGVEKDYVENIAVKKKIPLDSVVVKMSQEEAITPMKKSIVDSLPKVKEALDEALSRTKENGKIVIVGVGNTSGVGNNKKDQEKARKIIDENIKKMKKAAGKKKRRIPNPFAWS